MALIMIADDDANYAAMICAFLETQGHSVVSAGDALELFKKLQGRTPDLFILDMKMPGGGGPGAVKFLGETPRASRTPIIILSAMPVEEQKRSFSDVSHIRFLRKPVELPELAKLVKELVAK